MTYAELDEAMLKFPNICKQFFRVESIIDKDTFKDILDSYFKRIIAVKPKMTMQDQYYELKKCQNGKRINKFLNEAADSTFYKDKINLIAEELESKDLKMQTREVLATIMYVLQKHPNNLTCEIKYLKEEPNIVKSKLRDRLEILRESGFISFDPDNTIEEIRIGTGNMDSPLYKQNECFQYIINFCKTFNIDYKKIFVEKDFTVFDE